MIPRTCPEERIVAGSASAMGLEQADVVKALREALRSQARQEQLLEKWEEDYFKARGQQEEAQKPAEFSKQAAKTQIKLRVAKTGGAHRVGEGSVPTVDTGDIWSKVCNQNYSFQVREDIYDRFIFPWESIEAGSKVVIYGGGIVGKIFLQQLQRASYCTVVAICDKKPEATGIVEAPVINLKRLAGLSQNSYDKVLIAVEKKRIASEIRQDLELAGVPGEKIVWVDPIREDLM